PGLLGTISSFPTCSPSEIRSPAGCDPATQVGDATVALQLSDSAPPFEFPGTVHAMDAGAGEIALLGIRVLGGSAVTLLHLDVRPDDFGLDATIETLPNLVVGTDMTLWGVPWDHWDPATQAATPRRPFMTNPAVCGQEAVTTVDVDSFANPGAFETYRATSPPLTGCGAQRFEPSISTRAGNPLVNQPSSLELGIAIPQSDDPDALGTPPLRDVFVTLPDGLTINPSVADGLAVCTDAAFGRGQRAASACPGESRIGTVGMMAPALPDPQLAGAVYLGEPRPGERFRLLLEAFGSGVRVKLAGTIEPDPRTGRLTAVFRDNPQVPVSAIRLALKGGPLAALAMPPTCGFKPVVAALSSWGGQAAGASALLQVGFDAQGGPCPEALPFAPRFTAGTVEPRAGRDAGFTMVLERGDRDRELGRITLALPPGLLGRLTAVPLCPAAQAADGWCDDRSLVGDARVWAGAGDSPIEVRGGRVHLTEPYREGDVAGLAIVVRAIAGPYDLGTAVVRAGIRVRPDTGLDVEAEPLPTIMEGVPLRVRRVQVDLGREGFMLNPSDCSPKAITGSITSADGERMPVAVPFGVEGCAELPFSPAMDLSADRPAPDRGLGLRVALRQDPGEARMRQVTLVLPPGLGARLEGPIQHPCPEAEFARDACPDASRVGTAEAATPVLPGLLTAPIHLVANPDGALPRLGVRLRSGPVAVDLLGEVSFDGRGRLVTVFDGIPDVPIERFALTLERGRQAVLAGASLCRGRKRAALRVIAHSGHVVDVRVPLAVERCPARSARRGAGRREAG
ncbi:MAG TPA: hypothetical protein VIL49_05345, partial [Capillimicrobium sp.]